MSAASAAFQRSRARLGAGAPGSRCSAAGAVLVSAALLALPALLLRHYRHRFDLDASIVVFGQALVVCAAALLGAAALGAAAAAGRDRVRCAERVLWVGGSALVTAWAAIFAGAYASHLAWGDTLTLGLLGAFLEHPLIALSFLPLTPETRAQLAWALAAGALACVGGVVAASRALAWWTARALEPWLAGGRCRARRAVLAGGLVVQSIAGGGTAAWMGATRPAELEGEPLSGFFEWFPMALIGGETSAQLEVAVADQLEKNSYPAVRPLRPSNVVLILADSLRADRMGVYGYARPTTPFLSSLAASGGLHRVEMALSTCSESFCGIASTLTSRPLHQISTRCYTLHALLRRAGYRTAFFLTGDHRHWRYLFDLYGAEVDELHDFVSLGEGAVTDDRMALGALERMAPFSGTPTLLYVFLMSSHITGARLPEYQRYTPFEFDATRMLRVWADSELPRADAGLLDDTPAQSELRERLSNRYDNGVLQADAMIERSFAALRAKGYLDDAIVVVLGDHGDALGEHGYFGHTKNLYQQELRIPLLIYDPGQRYANASFATQIDVAPTIAQRLGLPIPRGWQGVPLELPSSDRLTLHQTRRGVHPCAAAVERASGLFKYKRCGGGEHAPLQEELYDLAADPEERHDISESHPEVRERLRRFVEHKLPRLVNRCERSGCLQ